MPDWIAMLIVPAAYVVLMKWVLPGLGLPTCMSGACRTAARPEDEKKRDVVLEQRD
jgi:hypothetical protein